MDNSLGRRFREQRQLKGWTIEELATRVGISTNYMGALERGAKVPKLETFIRIAEVLDVSPDRLLRDFVAPASHLANQEIETLLENMTPQQKKAALDILNAYAENLPYLSTSSDSENEG